jgi:hypothetical protein
MRRRRPVERVELELERYGNDPDEWVARVNVVEAERAAMESAMERADRSAFDR